MSGPSAVARVACGESIDAYANQDWQCTVSTLGFTEPAFHAILLSWQKIKQAA